MTSRALSMPARIAGRLVLVVIAVSLAQTIWALRADRLRGPAELRERAERVAGRLAVALQAPIYSFDGATLVDVVAAELASDEVVAVRVEGGDLSGTWMRSPSGAGAVGVDRLPDEPGLLAARAAVMEPLDVPFPRSLGAVTVVVSSRPIEAQLRQAAIRRGLETLALVATLVIAAWVVLHRAVVRPLERIRATMVSAREGLASAPAGEIRPQDPVAGTRGALPELRSMGKDFLRLAEAVQQSRAALAAREADVRATLDSIGDGVITAGPDGRVLAMNPVAEGLTGVPAAEARGRLLDEVFPPAARLAGGDTVPASRDAWIGALLERGEPLPSSDALPLGDRAGRERWVTVTAAPVRRPGRRAEGIVVVFRDVTSQRALEDRVRQAYKMEAVGQLAGGVAHDFNNMLTPVLAYAQLIADDPAGSDEIRQNAAVIAETAGRAAELTKQLLAFSRKGARSRAPLSPTALVEETAALLRRTLDRSIEVRTEGGAAALVEGDSALLHNAMLNLALNARDAMPEGGVLRLASREVTLDAGDCAATGFEIVPGRYVEVTVADTGVGMAPDVQARIFEPFFTTKSAGKGTGLGLAAVYGTVREHRGAVLVHSAPGLGTTFRLLLPVATPASASSARPSSTPGMPRPAPASRRGTALVVEDEPRIRELMIRHLGAMAFEIVEAADGEAALDAIGRDGPIDLAVLDLVLPRAGGRKVFDALRAARPAVPVLFTSGFAKEEGLAAMLAAPRTAFLAKPWRPSELVEVVERLCG